MTATPPDRWSRWLLERRDADSERQRALAFDWLRPVRDRVLALAGPLEGATLLDVGAAFAASARSRLTSSDGSSPRSTSRSPPGRRSGRMVGSYVAVSVSRE